MTNAVRTNELIPRGPPYNHAEGEVELSATTGQNLPPRQANALALLSAGQTVSQVVEQTGVGERTVRRWLAEDEVFRQQLEALQGERLRELARYASAVARGALSTLAGIATDDTQPAAARVSASKTLLDLTLRLREAVSIEERLVALEAALEIPPR
jgi:hypothetical protein